MKGNMKLIAKSESEFKTKYLLKSKTGVYYSGVRNGGSRGSHQPADQVDGNWGVWIEPLRKITTSDAEALADEMGAEILTWKGKYENQSQARAQTRPSVHRGGAEVNPDRGFRGGSVRIADAAGG
jgi:hypothetical protein